MRVGVKEEITREAALIRFTKRCKPAYGAKQARPGKGKVAQSVNSAPPFVIGKYSTQ